MHYFPYKICHTQELLDRDKLQRLSFAVNFLNRMTVDLSWPWNTLWSDEANFYLNGTVNTQNCRIWAKENPRIRKEIPIQSPKVTVCCGFTATFIFWPFFFEKISERGLVTCSVTGRRYNDILQTFVVPQLHQRRYAMVCTLT
ncbi:transposable element tc3 transposase [Trichonephila clavipes]|nr:transposable element tc3 transposase [Trichonephila clavipes]